MASSTLTKSPLKWCVSLWVCVLVYAPMFMCVNTHMFIGLRSEDCHIQSWGVMTNYFVCVCVCVCVLAWTVELQTNDFFRMSSWSTKWKKKQLQELNHLFHSTNHIYKDFLLYEIADFTFTFHFEKWLTVLFESKQDPWSPQKAAKIRHQAISSECSAGMVRASGARFACSVGQWKETASGCLPSFQLDRDGSYGRQCLPSLIAAHQHINPIDIIFHNKQEILLWQF